MTFCFVSNFEVTFVIVLRYFMIKTFMIISQRYVTERDFIAYRYLLYYFIYLVSDVLQRPFIVSRGNVDVNKEIYK